jgi:hypothetical protein
MRLNNQNSRGECEEIEVVMDFEKYIPLDATFVVVCNTA